MWQNYLKTAWRNLSRHRSYALINIVGLTVGTACCLYLLLYAFEQFRVDKHHEDGERLYRIVSDLTIPGQDKIYTALSSPPIAPALGRELPEVEMMSRLALWPGVSHQALKWQNQSFFETKGYFADSTFFRMFTYQWVAGDRRTALDEPYSVVLTKPVADRLFGRAGAVGQVIHIGDQAGGHDFKVTGVVDAENLPSHIRGHYYMSMNSGGIGAYVYENQEWAGNNFINSYVLLREGADAAAVEAKLPGLLLRHGGDQLREKGMAKELHLEPVTDIHLYSEREGQLDATVNVGFLYLLLAIGGFIQLLACINFINLATARATNRGKEVAVRKTIGAGRGNLARQFFLESMLLATLGAVLALPVVWLTLPWLNTLLDTNLSLSLTGHASVLGPVFGLVLLTGLIAGSYPALYLSGLNTLRILKGEHPRGGATVQVRRALVVVQFIVSIGLIVGALTVQRQVHYLLNKDLGFEREQKIVVPFRTAEACEQLAAFKQQATRQAGVESVTAALAAPGQFIPYDFTLFRSGQTMDEGHIVRILHADEDYLPTLGIPLLSGRLFRDSDTTNQFIINETAAAALGLDETTAPGTLLHNDRDGERQTFEVIGVMADYYFQNLREEQVPLVMAYAPPAHHNQAIISVDTDDHRAAVGVIEQVWNELLPGQPFEFSFLDDDLQQLYEAESRLATLVSGFMLVAILISCLGLFGLSAFTVERRTREIGIRKVLGANAAQLVALISRDFLVLVLVALLLAVPVATYFISRWLERFPYHATLAWWIFALAAAGALLVALLTVSIQAARAAWADPVETLRTE